MYAANIRPRSASTSSGAGSATPAIGLAVGDAAAQHQAQEGVGRGAEVGAAVARVDLADVRGVRAHAAEAGRAVGGRWVSPG